MLVNGGAEDGLAGWSGTFAAPSPTARRSCPRGAPGRVLGGRRALLQRAPGAEAADLFQRIDVTAAAASIDRGSARAALSGLLGGYGADADALTVQAVFKDPENGELGALELCPRSPPSDRLNGDHLLHRAARRRDPARTRAIDVMLHGERKAGGYTDAYADNLALVLSVPGVPVDASEPDDPPVDGPQAVQRRRGPDRAAALLARGRRARPARVRGRDGRRCSGSLSCGRPAGPDRPAADRALRDLHVRRGAVEARRGPAAAPRPGAGSCGCASSPRSLVAVAHDGQGLERTHHRPGRRCDAGARRRGGPGA